VFELHGRQHAHSRVDHVGRIEAAPKADLDHAGVDPEAAKDLETQRGRDVEEARPCLGVRAHAFGRGLNPA